ncbi:MAG: flavin reductase family protein [Actinobacteria bacterium]|nr:flavin reductase family protein [Actinomycetota bacterium]MBW3646448.1 flavin reductase family protein [Actinomycetota bacterium]
MEHVASPEEMRRVLGSFASGVVIVTGDDDGSPVGFTCQSFASVSLDPPLVLFCPAHTSLSWPRIRASGRFAVNVLADDQQHVSARFAVKGADKFAGLAWYATTWGPAIEGTLATVLCTVEDVHVAGDHDIVVGRVQQLVTHREDAPLLFFRGAFGLAPSRTEADTA